MKPLSPGAQRALREYRREHSVPSEVRERLLTRLEQPLPDAQTAAAPGARPGRGLRLLRWGGPLAVLVVGLGFSLRSEAPPLGAAPQAESAPIQPASPTTGAATQAPASLPLLLPSNKRAGEERPAQRAKLRKVPRRSSAVSELDHAPALQTAAAGEAQAPATGASAQLPEDAPLAREPSAVGEPAAQTQRAWQGGSAPAQERQRAADAPRPALSLDDEVMLLRRVSELLAHGDPLRAMSALAEHARLFPDGKLVTMRKAARVRALCELGKRVEAEREAAQFLAAHRDSPYAAQVRGGCQR